MIDKKLAICFRWWASLIYDHSLVFMILPVLLAGGMSTGFLFLNKLDISNTPKLLVPEGGQSFKELAKINTFWPFNPDNFVPGINYGFKNFGEVIIIARNSGNLLDGPCADAAAKLSSDIDKLFIRLINGTKVKYEDLCLRHKAACNSNRHVSLLRDYRQLKPYFDFTYPRANLYKNPVYLANVFGSVNRSDSIGHPTHIGAVKLVFYLRHSPEKINNLSKKWLFLLKNFIVHYNSTLIDLAVFHSESIADGLIETSDACIPKFSQTMVILIIFTAIQSFCLLRNNDKVTSVRIDWIKSQPLVALAGVLAAGMGILSGMGFLLLSHIIPFNRIIAIMPFLVMSIGVDDMFILLAAWHRSPTHTLSAERTTAKERFIYALEHSAISITVTSITDILSFGIGAISKILIIRVFCIYTAVSICFTFIFQLTFFVAVLAMCGKREMDQHHCITFQAQQYVTPEVDLMASDTLRNEKKHCYNLRQPLRRAKYFEAFLKHWYVPVLLNPIISAMSIFWLISYLLISIYGCFSLQEGLEVSKLVLKSHHVHKWYGATKEYLGKEGPMLSVYIMNPPNFGNKTLRRDLERFLAELESTPYSMGYQSTQFWFRDYVFYLSSIGYPISEQDEPELWSSRLLYWLTQGSGRLPYGNDVILKLGQPDIISSPVSQGSDIQACRFVTGMKNFLSANDHRFAAQAFRRVADKFSQFGVVTYHIYWPYADQYEAILPNTLQNIGIALMVMAVVAFAFIPSTVCAVIVVLTVVSIDLGVIGFMSHWRVNLDAISMITVIMSIGFAVDLSAHITYAFTAAQGSPQEKILQALLEAGSPVLQGALSTIFGMLALLSVDSYIIVTFFKTIFLVMIIGLIHSLVFLPVLLVHSIKMQDFVKSFFSHCSCQRGNYEVNPISATNQ